MRSAGIFTERDLESFVERHIMSAINEDERLSVPGPHRVGYPIAFRGMEYRGGFLSREGYLRTMIESELSRALEQ